MVHAVGFPAVGDNVRVSSSRPVGTKGVSRAQRTGTSPTDESAVQMSRQSRRVLTAFSAAIIDMT